MYTYLILHTYVPFYEKQKTHLYRLRTFNSHRLPFTSLRFRKSYFKCLACFQCVTTKCIWLNEMRKNNDNRENEANKQTNSSSNNNNISTTATTRIYATKSKCLPLDQRHYFICSNANVSILNHIMWSH